MQNLADLPHSHVLRNTPLGQLDAYRKLHARDKTNKIPQSWKIAKSTYNQLSGAWIAYNDFYVAGNDIAVVIKTCDNLPL